MAKRFVIVEGLGTRANWPSIRRKVLEGLREGCEGTIRGGRVERKKRIGLVELASEEIAEKVVSYLDGLVDKDGEVRGETTPWRARLAEDDSELNETNGDGARGGRSRSSPSPRRPPARPVPPGRSRSRSRGRSNGTAAPQPREDRRRPRSASRGDSRRRGARDRSPSRRGDRRGARGDSRSRRR